MSDSPTLTRVSLGWGEVQVQGLLGVDARSGRSWLFLPSSLGVDGDKGQGIAPLKGPGDDGEDFDTNSPLLCECFVLPKSPPALPRGGLCPSRGPPLVPSTVQRR